MPSSTSTNWKTKLKMLGPGLLFAGAAVGVSHLVQSTRAGAEYGFGLLWVVLLIHLFKYPFFEYGPRYASSTGESLLRGYMKLGKGVMYLFFFVTIGSMFTVQSAVTFVTAGLAVGIFGLTKSMFIWVCVILFLCLLLLSRGQYSMLDNIMKVIILVLTVSTIFAVVFALGKGSGNLTITPTFPVEAVGITFLIALMGWMPGPVEISCWQSLWMEAKTKNEGKSPTLQEALRDFNFGYIICVFLAILFLGLGAMVMYGTGTEFSNSAFGFASQVVDLYTKNIGEFARPVIALAAFTTMFSTTITLLDAYPRSLGMGQAVLQNKQEHADKLRWLWSFILYGLALVIIIFFTSGIKTLVDIVTITAFLAGPYFGYLNIKLIFGGQTPKEAQPKLWIKTLAYTGFWILTAFALFFLGNKFL